MCEFLNIELNNWTSDLISYANYLLNFRILILDLCFPFTRRFFRWLSVHVALRGPQ